MKMKCLDYKVCVYHNTSCYYDDINNHIGCECVQTPTIYLHNHPLATSIQICVPVAERSRYD